MEIGEVTEILHEFKCGTPGALDRLIPLVYAELRRVAAAHLRREYDTHSLQITALVHETYLRMADVRRLDWQDKAHFLSVSSTLMRRILVEHARSKQALKRGGGGDRVCLDEAMISSTERAPEVIALDDALNLLSKLDERQAKVIEMRFFAGMTEEEIASVLGISVRTVKRDWRLARAWLFRELRSSAER